MSPEIKRRFEKKYRSSQFNLTAQNNYFFRIRELISMSIPATRSSDAYLPVIRIESANVLHNAISSAAARIQQIYVPSASPNKSLSRQSLSPTPSVESNLKKRPNPFDDADEGNLNKRMKIN